MRETLNAKSTYGTAASPDRNIALLLRLLGFRVNCHIAASPGGEKMFGIQRCRSKIYIILLPADLFISATLLLTAAASVWGQNQILLHCACCFFLFALQRYL